MAYNKVQLKNLNANRITTNSNEEITGEVLREHLVDFIDSVATTEDGNIFKGIQQYNIAKTFTTDLDIVDKGYVDGKVAGISFYELITYADLVAKIDIADLSIGKLYILTDFKTHTLANLEVLVLKASSTNTIYKNVASITYPNDVLEYSVSIGGGKGTITKRIDEYDNITYYDSKYFNVFNSCNSIHLGYNTSGFSFPTNSNNTTVSANLDGSAITFGSVASGILTNTDITKTIYKDLILGIVLEYRNNGDVIIIDNLNL